MLPLLTAIQTRFNASAYLMSRFAEGCYLSLAQDDSAKPTAVVQVISAVPTFSTCNDYLTAYGIQFDVYADTDTEALEAIADVRAQFDFCALSVAGGTCVEVRPINSGILKEDKATFHAFVEYQILLQETY